MKKSKEPLLGKAGEKVSDKVVENTKETIKINHNGSKTESISKERKGKFKFKKAPKTFYLNEIEKFEANIKVYLSHRKKAFAILKRGYNKILKLTEILKVEEEQNRSESEIAKTKESISNQMNKYYEQFYVMLEDAEKSHQNQFRELLKVSFQIIEEMLPQVVNDDKELMEELLFRISHLLFSYRYVSSEYEYQTLINSIEPDVYELLKNHTGENKYVSFSNLVERKHIKKFPHYLKDNLIPSR